MSQTTMATPQAPSTSELRLIFLSAEELFEHCEKPCNANLFTESGGRLQYLFMHLTEGKTYVTLFMGERVIAMAGMKLNPDDAHEILVTFVSVEEKHQGNGFGRMLAEAIYAYANEHDKQVHPSSFSPMGHERLENMFRRLDAVYPACACTCSDCKQRED